MQNRQPTHRDTLASHSGRLRELREDHRLSGNYSEIEVLSGLATIRELSERQDEQRAMIGALLRGLARPGSHAAINNHG